MESNKHFYPADILLPKRSFEKWAVIACDQYTSEPEYWDGVEKNVGDTPSALRVILPEARLGSNDDDMINKINNTMCDYLKNGVFSTYSDTVVYVEREVTGGKIRRGIVGLIDLEDYDYRSGSHSLIRATEATVLERIPPRVKIRENATLELPHIMLLTDDPMNTVIEPLSEKKSDFRKLYDFNLMNNSGHITGYAVDNDSKQKIDSALNSLISNSEDKLLFAVGDGNHSLASAKECYNQNPTPLNRYALVEVVNIHDESLEFEPIYRVVFNCNPEKLINDFIISIGGEYRGSDAQKFTCIYGECKLEISVKGTSKLCVGTLQTFLDDYIKENSEIKIDYIHGCEVVKSLSKQANTVGFIFDGMRKDELFSAVKADGALPRKTFSMGHAADKRFYIESRKIK